MKKIYTKIVKNVSSFFFKKGLSYYPRYNYYQTRLRSSRGERFYGDLFTIYKNNIGIKTNTEIKYDDNQRFSDISRRRLIKLFGKPNYEVQMQNTVETSVLFYKQKFGAHKVKVEFHFFNNNLLFYVYTFPNIKSINEITQVIQEKYLEGEKVDIINKNIIDKNNNKIHVRKSVYFEVYYLCNNKNYFEKLSEAAIILERKNKLKQKNNKEELFQKL